jgi:hypothetical protein
MRRLVIDHLGIDGARLDAWVQANAKRSRALSPTEVRGMRRSGGELGQVRAIELEVVALLLLEPRALRERLEGVIAALPNELDGAPLEEFQSLCEAHAFDVQRVLLAYREREEGGVVFERVLRMTQLEDARVDVQAGIDAALSRLRELHIERLKVGSQARLMDGLETLARRAEDPSLSDEERDGVYAELQRIRDMQRAREAERRSRAYTRPGKGRRRGLG